jgi:recombination protein RecA
MTPAKTDPLDDIFARAEKKYGLRVGTMDKLAEGTLWLTTGNLAIDFAFGQGIPLGRSVELSGPPSCGKTTVALHTAIELQKCIKAGGDKARGIGPDDIILYLDYENAMDPDYAVALGLDIGHKSLRFAQPDTLEEGLDIAIEAIKTGRVRLVIVDSVAAMVPSAQAEAESIGTPQVALAARLLKTAGQNLNPVLRKNNCTMIWINHETTPMAVGKPSYGPPQTSTPGGVALKYFASVRAKFRQIKNHKGPWTDPLTGEIKEIPMMTDVRMTVLKNKVGRPFQEALLRVRFGRGFDNFWTAMQILTAHDEVSYSASNKRYYFENVADRGGAPSWMGREDKKKDGRPYIWGEKTLFAKADKHADWRQSLIDIASGIAAREADALKKVVYLREEEDVVEEFSEDMETPQELDDILGSEAATAAGRRVKI